MCGQVREQYCGQPCSLGLQFSLPSCKGLKECEPDNAASLPPPVFCGSSFPSDTPGPVLLTLLSHCSQSRTHPPHYSRGRTRSRKQGFTSDLLPLELPTILGCPKDRPEHWPLAQGCALALVLLLTLTQVIFGNPFCGSQGPLLLAKVETSPADC